MKKNIVVNKKCRGCNGEAEYLGIDERGEVWVCDDCIEKELNAAYKEHICKIK